MYAPRPEASEKLAVDPKSDPTLAKDTVVASTAVALNDVPQ